VQPEASVAELHDRIAALTATSRQNVTLRQERQSQLIEAWQELVQTVVNAATELSEKLTFYVHSQHSGYYATELLGRPPFMPHDAQDAGWLLLPPGQDQPVVQVVVAVAFRVLREEDPADISALVRVDRIREHGNVREPQEIWSRTYRGIPIASAQQANAVAEIRAGFTGSFAETLRHVIRILSDSATSR
jgi:hypothetical protein